MNNKIYWLVKLYVNLRFRISFAFLLVGLYPILSFAQNLVGVVIDTDGERVLYASVYFKNNPSEGTVTNLEGVFSIDMNKTSLPNDVLVVSFLGYQTQNFVVANINPADTLHVRLQEQPIELQDMVITADAGKRSNKKKAMAALLKQVEQRMDIDFKPTPVKYKVVSIIGAYNENEILSYEEMVGYVIEQTTDAASDKIAGVNVKRNQLDFSLPIDTDAVQFKGISCKTYINKELKDQFRYQLDSTAQKKHTSYKDSTQKLHEALWGGGTKAFFQQIAQEPKKWKLTRENEEEALLTYTDSKNILTIIKIKFICHYIIDTHTLQLKRISQNMSLSLNVPFGYKMNAEELKMLNMFNVVGADINKYRLKKVNSDIKRNLYYTATNDGVYVKEKNMIIDIKIQDNKANIIPFKLSGKNNVISTQTEQVKIYTPKELQQQVPRQIISISDIK